MKKIIAIISVLTIFAMCFTGCGDKEPTVGAVDGLAKVKVTGETDLTHSHPEFH